MKVNWNFQDEKYEYHRNQHGIYPQVHQPLRPFIDCMDIFINDPKTKGKTKVYAKKINF